MRRCVFSFAALAILLLALPSAALARTPQSPPAPPGELCPNRRVILNVSYYCAYEFTLPATNGYTVTVSASDGQGRSGDVELTATRGAESASYSVTGTVTAAGFSASFGRLGRLAVRFRPSGRVRHRRLSHRCFPERPPLVSSRLGDFRGTIRFDGEHDYTELLAHRASGGLGDPDSNTAKLPGCEYRASKAQRVREERAVTLQASNPDPPVSLLVSKSFGQFAELPAPSGTPPGERDLFLALCLEAPNGLKGPRKILILRTAAALAPTADFSFAPDLSQATLTPPPPFSGSASFQRAATGPTWSGDLGVSLPGLGTVSLSAPGTKAQLVRLADLEPDRG